MTTSIPSPHAPRCLLLSALFVVIAPAIPSSAAEPGHGADPSQTRPLAASSAAAAPRTIYVDNRTGNDAFDGLTPQPKGDGVTGPVTRLQRAFDLVTLSDRIEVANTEIPYTGGNTLTRVGGTAERPMVIEGNGATISGLDLVPASQWTPVEDHIYRTEFWPNSNHLKTNPDYSYWIGIPQIWWVNGKAARNCRSAEELRSRPGGFFWNKDERTVWFHLPDGETLAHLSIRMPVHNTGLEIHGVADHVVVQNLQSRFSWNDGFSAGGLATNLVFRHCQSTDNCGQGFSMHNSIRALVEDSLAERNASSGACDVHDARVTYLRCVMVNNSFEAGVYSTEQTQAVYEDCLILFNRPFEQVWQRGQANMLFVNSVIAGPDHPTRPLVLMEDGTVTFVQCTLSGYSVLADLSGPGRGLFSLANTLVTGDGGPLFGGAPADPVRVSVRDSVLPAKARYLGNGSGGTVPTEHGVRFEDISLEGDPPLQIPASAGLAKAARRWFRPSRLGANLPESVWALYRETRPGAPSVVDTRAAGASARP